MPTSGQTTIIIDTQESVLTITNTPPTTPTIGDRYLINTLPTGVWAGKANNIVEYTGTWAFTAPSKGMQVWIEDIVEKYYYDTSWVSDRYYTRNILEKLTGTERLSADYVKSGTINRLLLATEVGTSGTAVSASNKLVDNADSRMTNTRDPNAHTHGNISNSGAVGVAENLPLITGASGIVQVSSFGNSANTFCQGNDTRLSDSRDPNAHGNEAHTSTFATTSEAFLLASNDLDDVTDGSLFKKLSADEKDALIGTSGTALSSTNKVIDNDDNRILKTITKRAYPGISGLDTLDFDLPAGSLIFRARVTNEAALISSDGATSYSINLVGGSTETLITGAALTQDEKSTWNGFIKTFGLTYAEIVPNSGSFDDGEVLGEIQYLEAVDALPLVETLIKTHQATFDLVSEGVTLTISPDSDLHLDCGTEKTLVLDEEVWDDLPPVSLLTAPVGATAPTITALPGGRSARAMTFDLNDLSYIQSEITHAFKENSEIEIHVHWANNGSHISESRYVNFEVSLSIAKPLQEIGAEAVFSTGNLEIPANQPFTHYVHSFSANIPATDIQIGDMILGQFKRIATTGGAASPASHPFVFQVGFHGKKDTLGSRRIYNK